MNILVMQQSDESCFVGREENSMVLIKEVCTHAHTLCIYSMFYPIDAKIFVISQRHKNNIKIYEYE